MRVSADRNNRLACDYIQCEPVPKLLKKYKITRQRFYQILRAVGVPVQNRRRGPLKSERDGRIAEKYAAGADMESLMTEYGLKHQRLRSILREQKVPYRRKNSRNLSLEARVVELYNAWLPGWEVAAAVGRSIPYVYQVLRRHKIKTRPKFGR